MSKTTKNTETTTPASADAVVSAATALVNRLVALEIDPDLVSIVSIARAHGYQCKSTFWHQESNTLAAALQSYEESRARASGEVGDCDDK